MAFPSKAVHYALEQVHLTQACTTVLETWQQPEIESGGGTGGTDSYGGFKCCSDDSCGPSQILGGQYGQFAGNDKLNICDPADSAELLVRAMLLKLCQADHVCEGTWATDSAKAMKYTSKINTNSITGLAGAGYFNGSQGCVVTNCSQYRWGTNNDYCQSVMNFCKTGKILPDATDNQYCNACNADLIAQKQKPNTCP